jgi:hypothetical protein
VEGTHIAGMCVVAWVTSVNPGHAIKGRDEPLFKDKFVSADTDQSPQIHLDLEQTVTEYYSFPSSKVLNGQEKKDDVLTL